MAKEVIDYEIREDLDDDGNPVFDVYEQYVGDSEFVEAFQSREDAEKAIVRLKAENSRWLVMQAEDAVGYGHLFFAVTQFDTLDEAKEYAANVIRNEWAPMSTIATPDGLRNLADVPGYTYPPESVKWSKIHYSEDNPKVFDTKGAARKAMKRDYIDVAESYDASWSKDGKDPCRRMVLPDEISLDVPIYDAENDRESWLRLRWKVVEL